MARVWIGKMTTPLVLSQDDIEAGGNKHEFSNHGIEGDFAYNNNVHSANMSIRLGNYVYYINYNILLKQLYIRNYLLIIKCRFLFS